MRSLASAGLRALMTMPYSDPSCRYSKRYRLNLSSEPERIMDMYYLYKDAAGQWRWTLYAGNNRKIANSGEGYFNKVD